MAAEEVVRRQVEDRAGAPLPSTSPEAFGTGLARSVGEAAQGAHVRGIQAYQVKQRARTNADASIFQAGFGATREDLSNLARKGRNSDQPGHAERIGAEVAKRREELLQGIQDDDLRQRAAASFDDWAVRFRTGEADWEDLRQSELVVERFDEGTALAEGRVYRAEKPGDYTDELRIRLADIDMLDVADSVKEKLRDEAEQRLTISFMRGMTKRDPAAAKALVDSGAFDRMLTGAQLDALRNGAEGEINRQARAAEREAAEKAKKLDEAVATLEVYDRDGIERPDADYDAAIAIATAQGDTSRAARIATLKANKSFTRVWGPENATALQRQRRMAELASARDRTDAQDRELKFLRDHAGPWAEQENRDPVGQAKVRGGAGAPPEVDLGTGDNLNPRAIWASARGHDMFDEIEVRALQADMEQPGGETRTLAKLDLIDDPFARARAARQLAPRDEAFPIIAMVKPQARATMLQGRQAMRDNGSFFTPKDDTAKKVIAEADARLRWALRKFNVSFIEGSAAAWRFYAAGALTRQGQGDATLLGEEAGPRIVENAITAALGGEFRNGKRRGGLATWNDQAFALPENQTLTDFRDRVYKDLTRHRADPPVNPDKSPLVNFNRLTPVLVGKGEYQWESATGAVLRTKSGKIFKSQVLR